MHIKYLRIKESTYPAVVYIIVLATLAAASSTYGQHGPNHPQRPPSATLSTPLDSAISNVQKGHFSRIDIAVIIGSHDLRAITALETQFERCKDQTAKSWIADALVRMGEKNGPYWDFMVDRALQFLKNGPPTAVEYNDGGRVVSVRPSKKLVAWANNHHMSIQQAWNEAMIDAPGAIAVFGVYDDNRAIPILRKALDSDNDFVKVAAADSLAELQDTESVPAIIKVCEGSPRELASTIAESLAYFKEPEAQSAVDKYMSPKTAHILRDAIAHGKRPYH